MAQPKIEQPNIHERTLEVKNLDPQETLELFAKRASHDLRQPLAAVRLLLQQLPHLEDASQRSDTLAIALESVDTLHNQLESLVDAARLASGGVRSHRDSVSINQLADSLTHQIAPILGTGVHLESNCATLDITTDAALLEMLLRILLKNAAENTQSGTVTLTADQVADCVCFQVQDTGKGLSDTAMYQLGKPFWQNDSNTKSYKAGIGLGLFCAAQISELLDTELSITSTEGLGTTIQFSLPIGKGT